MGGEEDPDSCWDGRFVGLGFFLATLGWVVELEHEEERHGKEASSGHEDVFDLRKEDGKEEGPRHETDRTEDAIGTKSTAGAVRGEVGHRQSCHGARHGCEQESSQANVDREVGYGFGLGEPVEGEGESQRAAAHHLSVTGETIGDPAPEGA